MLYVERVICGEGEFTKLIFCLHVMYLAQANRCTGAQVQNSWRSDDTRGRRFLALYMLAAISLHGILNCNNNSFSKTLISKILELP